MIADYTRLQEASGVNISCDKPCVALTDIDWRNQLKGITDSIVFIDEGADFLKSKDFARAVKETDNYYVIFNRESLHDLPYSVNEIYEIKKSGKFHKFKKMYKQTTKHVYYKDKAPSKLKYDTLLTEDAKSGYQFYQHYFEDSGIECFTSESNSAIFKWLKEDEGRKVFVIADGAAFGSEIDRIMKMRLFSDIRLCLPESFEWLILKSGLIRTDTLAEMLHTDCIFLLDYLSCILPVCKYTAYGKYSLCRRFFHQIQHDLSSQLCTRVRQQLLILPPCVHCISGISCSYRRRM